MNRHDRHLVERVQQAVDANKPWTEGAGKTTDTPDPAKADALSHLDHDPAYDGMIITDAHGNTAVLASSKIRNTMPTLTDMDFDALAANLLENSHREDRHEYFARQLRQVWNARGAADLKTLEVEGWISAVPDVFYALRALDR